MFRTIIVMVYVALALTFVLPWLILWTILSGDISFMYQTFINALRRALRISGIRVHVEGLENIPAGVCIFASNHASNIDPVALVPNIPRRVSLLAKKEVFRIPLLSKALRLGKLIPVDRADKESAAESVETAVKYLKEGLSFCVYPEGTRSKDGRLMPFKKGDICDGNPRRRSRGSCFIGRYAASDAQRGLDNPPRRSDCALRPDCECSGIFGGSARCAAQARGRTGCGRLAGRSKTAGGELTARLPDKPGVFTYFDFSLSNASRNSRSSFCKSGKRLNTATDFRHARLSIAGYPE